jgi:hypothetical protein
VAIFEDQGNGKGISASLGSIHRASGSFLHVDCHLINLDAYGPPLGSEDNWIGVSDANRVGRVMATSAFQVGDGLAHGDAGLALRLKQAV